MNITSIGEILFDIYPDHKRLGGAPLNFIYHIKKLTDSGNIISRVGNDVLGNKITNELSRFGFSIDYIQHDHRYPTGKANVKIDSDGSPSFDIDDECAFDFIEMTEPIEQLLSTDTNCLYLGTLAQRSAISRQTIQSALNFGLKYFSDLNLRQDFYTEDIIVDTLKAANFIKVNYEEMRILNDMLLQTEYSTEKAAFELMDRFEINMISVTRGKDGASIFENGKRFDHSNENISVVDATGAGDAYSAVLCLGYLNGLDIPIINKLANDFAMEICKFEGALPKNDRLYENLREQLGFF